ncbi:MAG: hypothetical protein HRT40_11325 [Campylobacteraceae bacterium]|nr:hypothetical protein [Campylobacteraceae bacterium]
MQGSFLISSANNSKVSLKSFGLTGLIRYFVNFKAVANKSLSLSEYALKIIILTFLSFSLILFA